MSLGATSFHDRRSLRRTLFRMGRLGRDLVLQPFQEIGALVPEDLRVFYRCRFLLCHIEGVVFRAGIECISATPDCLKTARNFHQTVFNGHCVSVFLVVLEHLSEMEKFALQVICCGSDVGVSSLGA